MATKNMSSPSNSSIVANSSIPLSYGPEAGSSDTASPYSIFWSLVAIATASITQPSSLIYSYPNREVYPAHSSPIVCGFEALNAVLVFLLELCRQIGSGHPAFRLRWYYIVPYINFDLRRAAWIAISRPINLQDQWAEVADHQCNGVQERKTVVVGVHLLFALGSLLQGVKLMAIGGIMWTKLWALLYIIPFAILNVLRLAGQTYPCKGHVELFLDQDNSFLSLKVRMAWLAIASQLVLWYWAILDLFKLPHFQPEAFGWPMVRLLISIFVLCGLIMNLQLLPLFTISYLVMQSLDLSPSCLFKFYLWCIWAVMYSICCIILLFAPIPPQSLASSYLSPTFVNDLLPFLILYILQESPVIKERRVFLNQTLAKPFDIIVFFSPFVNFVLAWLWYTRRYDPSTTYKPRWVDMLG